MVHRLLARESGRMLSFTMIGNAREAVWGKVVRDD